VDIKDFMFAEMKRPGGAILAGLEHLDDRYLKAVGYATKSKRGTLPKMVLIGDIVGDDEDRVARATSEVIRLANGRSGEGFVAVSADARKKFWADRKRTAAIAKHTNAFKVNEDVVIPLPRMGEYTLGIERINIELSLRNKLALVDALQAFVTGGQLPMGKVEDAAELPSPEALAEKVAAASAHLQTVRERWAFLYEHIDTPLSTVDADLVALGYEQHRNGSYTPQDGDTVFNLLQTWSIRASWKKEIRDELAKVFNGAALSPVLDELKRIHKQVLRGRVWVALHMHAGDGNVHTNSPVNSDNYEMLQTAHEAVARIMKLARSLDGVI